MADASDETNPRFFDDLARECLVELADEQFQNDVWTGRNAPPNVMASFVEAACGLFDDSFLGSALDTGWVYGEPVDGLLRRLSVEIDAIDEYAPIDELLANPRMRTVRALAAEILQQIEGRPLRSITGSPFPSA